MKPTQGSACGTGYVKGGDVRAAEVLLREEFAVLHRMERSLLFDARQSIVYIIDLGRNVTGNGRRWWNLHLSCALHLCCALGNWGLSDFLLTHLAADPRTPSILLTCKKLETPACLKIPFTVREDFRNYFSYVLAFLVTFTYAFAQNKADFVRQLLPHVRICVAWRINTYENIRLVEARHTKCNASNLVYEMDISQEILVLLLMVCAKCAAIVYASLLLEVFKLQITNILSDLQASIHLPLLGMQMGLIAFEHRNKVFSAFQCIEAFFIPRKNFLSQIYLEKPNFP